MISFFVLAFSCVVGWTNSERCPVWYQRFSAEHSYCLPPNTVCNILHSGVTEFEKELILEFHNGYRSHIAMGNEDRLPEAADMLQMEWDDELAAIAQKWTDNCKYEHDCNECRSVENFAVGQNLAFQQSTCEGHNCSEDDILEPDWFWAITNFYNEMKDYHKDWLESFAKHPGPKTDHFTQLIWAKSWRIGCGYTVYKRGGVYARYYACNYGPTGNVEKKPVYQEGPACSGCPVNSHCQLWSMNSGIYPGLCKMDDPNTAPIYRHDNALFYCNSSSENPDCLYQVAGAKKWDTITSLGGNHESITLKGGESSSITFDKLIVPHGKGFCVVLEFRKGPLDSENEDQSILKAQFDMPRGSFKPKDINSGSTNYKEHRFNLKWGKKTQLSFSFSVPRGAPTHILDIKEIMAFDGRCDAKNDYR